MRLLPAVAALLLAVALLGFALELDSADASTGRERMIARRAWLPSPAFASSWRAWNRCTTKIYVVAGPDGIVPGSERDGGKKCPAWFSSAKRRRFA